jgi:uncharacterized protein YjbI with pentapeptide repeats
MEKEPFAIERPGNDYSGMSFRAMSMRNQQRENSFFNGVDFTDCEIAESNLSHCELSEAFMRDCSIHSADFSSSDFINSVFENCEFRECDFRTGEWRSAKFCSCSFMDCNFDRTTVALTDFYDCQFDQTSMQTMLHRAVSFNVFSGCRFPQPVKDDVFSSRNFGIPCELQSRSPATQSSGVNLEQLCILRNLEKMEVADLLDAIRAAFDTLGSTGRRRASTFEFITQIVRATAAERRISPTSLVLVEDFVTGFASGIENAEVFNIAMTLVIEIRSILFEIGAAETTIDHEAAADAVQRIELKFRETFDRGDVDVLLESILTVGNFPSDGLRVDRLENGSTYIEAATTAFMSLGPLLIALNFILRQATVTVERMGQMKCAVRKAIGAPPAIIPKRDRTKNQLEKRVHAVADGKTASREVDATRKVVRRSGTRLAKLDAKASVHVTTQRGDLG